MAVTWERLITDSGTATLTNKTLTDPKLIYAINAQTGTTYTFVLTDASKLVTFDNASTITVTIPTNTSVAFPIGTQINAQQIGNGKVTFAGEDGTVTFKNESDYMSIGVKNVGVSLIKTGTNLWTIQGVRSA